MDDDFSAEDLDDWRIMNGPDHYRAAEGLLEVAESHEESSSKATWCLELAKVHVALAQVTATAVTLSGDLVSRNAPDEDGFWLPVTRAISRPFIFIGFFILPLILLWGSFFISAKHTPLGGIVTAEWSIGIAAGIFILIAMAIGKASIPVTCVLLAWLFMVLILEFSIIYWTYGSSRNFSISLSHLDAIYFTLGTLTTAGTGNVTPISEVARQIQAVQMSLDFGLVVFVVALVLMRLPSILE